MPLEQEVMGLLIGGFTIVMGIAMIAVLYLLIKEKSKGHFWIVMHLLLVSVSVYFALKGLAFDYNHPMASEEISLLIGISGVVWAFSMICLVAACFIFPRRKIS
ncbi:hypothetical protein A8F94_15555 [Bacillus sp. FJAT-27225]|uniref:hypothetical protein n=1 Tax=Bacillus sp. FJAT-27225 TaxID=1743144 RepID=UPI00080C2E58|nr:hypothetical protein [Bacillus sp. FJAT-27225]OCA84137.1 hypothetical protein A8F94_15555 [Bacillus sp. FJAT-27225]